MCHMPLDQIVRQYADMLYQKELMTIIAKQKEELGPMAADFARRNMTNSGSCLSARAAIHWGHWRTTGTSENGFSFESI